jgi:proline racemase
MEMKIQKSYTATDVHVSGEAYRIIKDGPLIHYKSIQELNGKFSLAYEEEIKFLLNEPRGFAGLMGCLVVPPFKSEADAAVIFFDHNGTIPMQYGGVVAVITALLECGQLKAKSSGEYRIETISGVIGVAATMKDDEVKLVKLKNEPCQVVQTNVPVSYLDLKTEVSIVQADHLYVIFDKAELPFEIEMEDLPVINQWGQKAIEALEGKYAFSRVILLDHSQKSEGKMKTVTFRPDRYIVRSPGFGTLAACSTYLIRNGDISADTTMENESIFNGKLRAKLSAQFEAGYEYSFSARGFITGMQTYVLDPSDPLFEGFLLK